MRRAIVLCLALVSSVAEIAAAQPPSSQAAASLAEAGGRGGVGPR